MVIKKIDDESINALQEVGLNYEEALIYYTLVKFGKKGATVRKLNLELREIERTKIYQILDKLIKKECIFDVKSTDTLKKAKLFIVLEPYKFFNKVLLIKEEQLKSLKQKEFFFTNKLQKIYEREKQYTIEDIDPLMQPYIKPFLKEKWKVSNQVIEKGSKTFGYDIYEYYLNPPDIHYLKGYYGFHIFVFDHILTKQDYDIELNFTILQTKRKIKEMFFNEFKIKDTKIKESEVTLLDKNFSSLSFSIKPEKSKEYTESVFECIFFPLDNKIFYIGAVKPEKLLDILKIILRVENISFNE
ncbi:MAG: helix-turn-helix domain-containing protein [Promethearchaeota archaeon]